MPYLVGYELLMSNLTLLAGLVTNVMIQYMVLSSRENLRRLKGMSYIRIITSASTTSLLIYGYTKSLGDLLKHFGVQSSSDLLNRIHLYDRSTVMCKLTGFSESLVHISSSLTTASFVLKNFFAIYFPNTTRFHKPTHTSLIYLTLFLIAMILAGDVLVLNQIVERQINRNNELVIEEVCSNMNRNSHALVAYYYFSILVMLSLNLAAGASIFLVLFKIKANSRLSFVVFKSSIQNKRFTEKRIAARANEISSEESTDFSERPTYSSKNQTVRGVFKNREINNEKKLDSVIKKIIPFKRIKFQGLRVLIYVSSSQVLAYFVFYLIRLVASIYNWEDLKTAKVSLMCLLSVSSVVTLSASGLVGFRFRGMIRKRNNM
jgi:hypothetical protein